MVESAAVSLARSRAFREASLRSEVYRASAVIVIAVLVGSIILIPGRAAQLDASVRIAAGVGLVLILGIQLCVLAIVGWARRLGRMIPTWLSLATLIVECLIPGGIMLSQVVRGPLPPFAALNTPPVLVYGLFIVLTTLRLQPVLCVVAGAACAGSYAGMVAYIVLGLGIEKPTTGLPLVAYGNSTAIIFATGLAAAWVARELRRHMQAALSEAETRVQMSRLEHDLSIAQSIQRALLPSKPPTVSGYDIAGWNRSADQTGGDYYDWQELPGGNWMVTLADVSGHGIGPALVTAACRAYVRANSFYNADLASLTERMNRLLADDLPDGRFVTMASVLIDPKGGPVQLLSAGHGPIVMYVGATGELSDILPQDMPLAVLADSSFGPAMSVRLAPGDVLALVTDGFVEWARGEQGGRREQYGMDRLRASLRTHASLPAKDIIDAVAADVAAFAGGVPQQDDLTMVVIKAVAPRP